MLYQVGIALDQLLNTFTGGWADETISSRAYRMRHRMLWYWLHNAINGLFFWQPNHCRAAYQSERERQQSPPELRRIKI